MSPRASPVSGARWLVGVLAVVVLAFGLATAVGEHLERTVAARANLIISNAMPSVQVLSAVRGDLRKLDVDLDRFAAAKADDRAALGEQVWAVRHDMNAALATYRALPFFEGEPKLYTYARQTFDGLDDHIAQYLAAGDPPKLARLHRQTQLIDGALQRIISFDASQGQRLGLEIERIRGETRDVVMMLDAASVLLAVGAGWLAIRQLRQTERTQRAERDAGERRERELAAQNEALGQFAGRVAHDVLSPLSTATLAMELMQQPGADQTATRRMADKGLAAVSRVQTLVRSLLTFAQAGGQPEPGAKTEIAPVLSGLLEASSGDAAERRIQLRAGPPPQGEVACSEGVLISILSNLVRNAIKHMSDSVDRRIEVRTIDRGARWRFEVEDTGPGIPAEQQERIFQPYVQLKGGAGIGLGLATVDRLVRAHGGTLGVISQGRGALFWFELPKPAAELVLVPELGPVT